MSHSRTVSRTGLFVLTLPLLGLSLLAASCGDDDEPTGGGVGGASGAGGRGGSGSGGSGSGGSGTGGSAGSGSGGSGSGGSGGSPGSGGGGGVDAGTGGSGSGGSVGNDGSVGDTRNDGGGEAGSASPMTSFFITSRTGSGDLGGLAGADTICQNLAAAVGVGGKTWKAYLGADEPATNPSSRIGTGPWYNSKGVKIADDIAGLHGAANMINAANGLTENGVAVANNQHDILTGANADGTLAAGKTCMNWSGTAGVARVGHHNRMGGTPPAGMTWHSAHDSQGCSAAQLVGTGGAGRFYCFATTP